DFRYLHLGKMYRGSTKVENPQGAEESFATHQLGFNYRPDEVLTFSLLVPVTWRSSLVQYQLANQVGGAQQPQHHTGGSAPGEIGANGLGDIIALAKYRLLDENVAGDDPFTLAVSGGVKLPTGKSDVKHADGDLLDPHM